MASIDKDEFEKEINSIKSDVKNLDSGLVLVKKRLEDLEYRHSQNCVVASNQSSAAAVQGQPQPTAATSKIDTQDKKIDKQQIDKQFVENSQQQLQQQRQQPILAQNLRMEPAGIIDHGQPQHYEKVIYDPNSVTITKKLDTASHTSTTNPPSLPPSKEKIEQSQHVQNGTLTTTTSYTKCTYVSDSYSNVVPYGLQDLQNGPVDQSTTGSIRLIGLKKPKTDSHLGLTVRQENGQLVVEKLDDNSQLSKQGLLHVGDWIVEINGTEVKTPDDLKNHLKDTEAVTLKVVPSGLESPPLMNGDFVRCCYDYDPTQDDQIPSKSIGLAFKVGDVLQLISKEDPEWWQARKVNDWSYSGLIPSQYLAERRKATGAGAASGIPTLMVGGEIVDGDAAKKKAKKIMYNAKNNAEFDENDIQCYEEVCKLSPYGRRVLVLIGATGVGRRTLKARLMHHDKDNFATVTPYTSRKQKEGELEGREYHFATKSGLEKDIDQGNFLEWGEFNGNIYGTKMDSVRKIIKSGRVCVLDCSPQAIKYLYNSEFMPFIVFIAPPPLEEFKQIYQIHPNRTTKVKTPEDLARICEESATIVQQYRHLFDFVLVNRNAEVTFRRLYDALESLKSQPQWVPASWIYG